MSDAAREPSPATAAPDRGRDASNPFAIPPRGWKDVLLRTWSEAGADNAGLIAAGVAFYGFLAMVPLLGAIVLSYGLVASPATVTDNIRSLTSVMPAEAAKLVGEQLLNLVHTSDGKKGFGLLIALGVAIYGAMNGADSVVIALNVAYDEAETRGFIARKLLNLAITLAAVVVALAATVSVAALGHLETLLPGVPGVVLVAGKLLAYLLMALVGAGAAAALFRYGPDRDRARWIWLTPGSLLTTLLWLVITLGFGIYVANFGSYDATYGSLGAVVVLLTWLYLSAYVLMLGAELNAELEHQTARDSTDGAAKPLGARGANAADTVAGKTEPADGDAKEQGVAPAAEATPPSPVRELAAGRVAARAGRIAGLGRLTLAPSLLATGGLMLLRRRGRLAIGVALLASSGALAWLGRERDEP